MLEWPTKPLGELCQLVNGRAFKPTDWGKEGLRIVRIQNLNDPNKPFNYYSGEFRAAHHIDDGEILLSWSGTPGTSFGCFRWLGGPGLLNQHIFKVLVDASLMDGDFFIYAVNSKLDEMISQAHGGVGLRHITKGKLEAIRLPVPTLFEQRRVVDRINDCIGKLNEVQKLRAEGQREVELLNSAVFADFVESKISDVRAVTLGDVVTECKYGTSVKASVDGKGCPVLRMGNIKDGKLDVSDLKYVELPPKEREKYLLGQGDILVNRTNSLELVGKSAVCESLAGEWVYASYLVRLRVDQTKALPEFVNGIINSRIGRTYVLRTARRAIGMVNINAKEIQKMPLPLPDIKVQKALVERMKAASPLIDGLTADMHNDSLALLKPAILRKAFAGEL